MVFYYYYVFFFNATATTEIYTPLYTLSLHDALPISPRAGPAGPRRPPSPPAPPARSEEHTSELQSHSCISYAVFCLKKKKTCESRRHSRDSRKTVEACRREHKR